jgi:hypothetical protein
MLSPAFREAAQAQSRRKTEARFVSSLRKDVPPAGKIDTVAAMNKSLALNNKSQDREAKARPPVMTAALAAP